MLGATINNGYLAVSSIKAAYHLSHWLPLDPGTKRPGSYRKE